MAEKQTQSILKLLAASRIMKIERQKDGNFAVCEMCDEWFGIPLTADQLRQLSKEIRALANQKVTT